MTQDISKHINLAMVRRLTPRPDALDLDCLGDCEMASIYAWAHGMKLRDIAKARGRAETTIRASIKASYFKLGVKTRGELTVRWWRDTPIARKVAA